MSYFVWNKIDHAVVREDDGRSENYALSVIPAKAGIHGKVFYYLEYKTRI